MLLSKKNVRDTNLYIALKVGCFCGKLHGIEQNPYRVDKFESWEIEVGQLWSKVGKNQPKKLSPDEQNRLKLQTSRLTVYRLPAEILDCKS